MRARTICGEMRSRRARILTAGNAGLAGVHTVVSTVHTEARLSSAGSTLLSLVKRNWRGTYFIIGRYFILAQAIRLDEWLEIDWLLTTTVCNKLAYL